MQLQLLLGIPCPVVLPVVGIQCLGFKIECRLLRIKLQDDGTQRVLFYSFFHYTMSKLRIILAKKPSRRETPGGMVEAHVKVQTWIRRRCSSVPCSYPG